MVLVNRSQESFIAIHEESLTSVDSHLVEESASEFIGVNEGVDIVVRAGGELRLDAWAR